jgi:photosystem II stability/assembly factor-like uncharacterized protein
VAEPTGPGGRLAERLAARRRWLVDSIEAPPLEQVVARAGALRRRRRQRVQAAGSLLAALAVLAMTIQPWHRGGTGVPPVGQQSTAPAPVWRGLGITLTGLVEPAVDLPGTIVDVEFADPDRGYLLSTQCPASGDCQLGFARTVDGGHSWQSGTPPVSAVPQPLGEHRPRLWTVGTWVAFVGADGHDGGAYASDDGGAHWSPRYPSSGIRLGSLPPGARLWPDAHSGEVLAWLPDGATPVALAHQPPITVRWTAETEAGDDAWWVGGSDPAGNPALAVTRDRGQTWQRTSFTEPGGYEVRVATLGRDVYAVVLGPPGQPGPPGPPARVIDGFYHSADGGAHFARTRQGGAPGTLADDLVPLLDGRLLMAGADGSWYVSLDNGATFTVVPDLLSVRRIGRTWTGYVAYDLLGGGWCAYSVDGSNWYKLSVR